MRSNPKRYLPFVLIVLSSFFLAGLAKCQKKAGVISLTPNSKRFYSWTRGDNNAGLFPDGPVGIPCPGPCYYNDIGTLIELPADDSTVVGYAHMYDPGTPPCRCWEWHNRVYRGYVSFDLSPLKNKDIISATLHWHNTTRRIYGETATGEGTCVKEIYYATEPWRTDNFFTAGALIRAYENPIGGESAFNVSDIVKSWANGSLPNYGFFFVGPYEHVNAKDNDRCTTILTNLRLEVLYAENK